MHVKVADPLPVTEDGVSSVHSRPAGMGESLRVTVPVNPLWSVTVIVDVAVVVPSALTGAGLLAEIEKSVNVYVTVAV